MDYRYYKKGEQMPYDLNIIVCWDAEKLAQKIQGDITRYSSLFEQYNNAKIDDELHDVEADYFLKTALYDRYSLLVHSDNTEEFKRFCRKYYSKEVARALPFRYCKFYQGQKSAPASYSAQQRKYWKYEKLLYDTLRQSSLSTLSNSIHSYQETCKNSGILSSWNRVYPVSLLAVFLEHFRATTAVGIKWTGVAERFDDMLDGYRYAAYPDSRYPECKFYHGEKDCPFGKGGEDSESFRTNPREFWWYMEKAAYQCFYPESKKSMTMPMMCAFNKHCDYICNAEEALESYELTDIA